MKHHLFLVILLSCSSIFFISDLFSNRSKPPTGRAGDPPTSRTCVDGCHQGTALNAGPGEVQILSNIPETGYEPNTLYTISAKVKDTSFSRFGFEMIPFSLVQEQGIGQIQITDNLRTQLVGSLFGDRDYVTHTAAGTENVDSSIWSFDWVSPQSGTGDIAFYSAFVAANANGKNTGDRVYSIADTIPEAGTAARDQNYGDIRFYSYVFDNQLIIEAEALEHTDIFLQVLNLSGQVSFELHKAFHTGKNRLQVDVSRYAKGLYFVRLQSAKSKIWRKFIHR